MSKLLTGIIMGIAMIGIALIWLPFWSVVIIAICLFGSGFIAHSDKIKFK